MLKYIKITYDTSIGTLTDLNFDDEKGIPVYDLGENTSLAYEVGVLRTYAEPLLYSINPESVYYEESIRILNFLKCFLNIPSEYVPQTSVLREFIGNGYFE